MAQQVVIAGAVFNNVPYIQCPDANNVLHSFYDTTIASNAATASDIMQGKLAYVNGSLVTGTNQGGGGSGLVYETGTWEPSADIANYTIQFANAHTEAPCMYTISDATTAYSSVTNSNYLVEYINFHQLFGCAYNVNNSGTSTYASTFARYRSTATGFGNSTTAITHPYTNAGTSSESYSRYWATETGIRAYTSSSSRYWRAGRKYKWIAVWKPTS